MPLVPSWFLQRPRGHASTACGRAEVCCTYRCNQTVNRIEPLVSSPRLKLRSLFCASELPRIFVGHSPPALPCAPDPSCSSPPCRPSRQRSKELWGCSEYAALPSCTGLETTSSCHVEHSPRWPPMVVHVSPSGPNCTPRRGWTS